MRDAGGIRRLLGGRVECERGERELVEPSRLLVAQQLGCLVAGPPRKVDRLGCVTSGRCEHEVMRELGEVRLGVSGVEILEGFSRAPMQRNPTRRRETVVERVADERVCEAQTSASPRHVRDDPRGDGLVEDVQQLLGGPSAEPFERVEAELPSEHRGEREDVDAFG